MKLFCSAVCGALLTAALVGQAPVAAQAPVSDATCERLGASLKLPDTTITSSAMVAAGQFTPPAPAGGGGGGGQAAAQAQAFQNLPAFCRVMATLRPTNDSDIKVEIWMPQSGWNGKLQAVGNGGWAGSIQYAALAGAVRRGYAAASTDTGHAGAGASFALGHPEKLIDYAYRAVHEMTVKGKATIAAFYGNAPRYSYFVGCSNGGRQGFKEAQRFPEDYDGIVAGAPAYNWTHQMAESMAVAHATLKDAASTIPSAKFAVLNKAAVEACDAADGLKDGLIGNPPQCRFDPQVLLCKDADGPACLTGAQVQAAKKIYTGKKDARGQELFPGLEPGSEFAWQQVAGGPRPFGVADDLFKYVVFKDPNWDFKTFDVDKDVELADKIDRNTINATDPNLKKFADAGGKLIIYHGWSDSIITPRDSVTYYDKVAAALGRQAESTIRLFMAPGMAHCQGGVGPNSFDMLTALEEWVEKGQPPARVIASHSADGKVDRTRPLCPYPQVAQYTGSGSIDAAENFVCKVPDVTRTSR
jgi:feruloyl esterase